jgi:tetratricopeptide (TPR) repeat protein
MSNITTKRLKLTTAKALVTGVLLAMASSSVIHAQDIIYKTDNKIIEAKVLKVSDARVEYKRFSDPGGPTYTILQKQVKMIIYQNGEKVVFKQSAKEPPKQKQELEPVQPETTLAPAAYSVVSYASARSLLLAENINSAIVVYAQLVEKDSANVSLSSEYAYALALAGIYDAALARLDRVWNLEANNSDPNYFASQVFTLMGFSQLAGEFNRKQEINTVPAWIAAKAPLLAQKYKRSKPPAAAGSREELVNDFKRANSLAAQNACLQSIGLFEEMTTKYPGEFLPYVGYSIVLEKAGLYAKSADSITRAISVIGAGPKQADARQFLEKRLLSLKTIIHTAGNARGVSAAPVKTADKTSRQIMAYAGGMIFSGYFNLNTKLGYFFSDSGNVSVNLGFIRSGGSSSFNLGLLYYQRYKKVMVGGFGLSCSTGNSSLTLNMKVSAGLSFMNEKKTASWDIFGDLQIPFSQDYAKNYGFSIGRSIYFGKR